MHTFLWWHPLRSRPAVGPRTRGQALVEFALILPIMMFLLLIAVDVGRMFATYISVSNGAREGALYAVQHPTDAAGGWTATKVVARQEAGNATLNVTVCPGDAGCALVAAGTVQVAASQSFSFLTPFITNGFGSIWSGFGGPLLLTVSASGDSL